MIYNRGDGLRKTPAGYFCIAGFFVDLGRVEVTAADCEENMKKNRRSQKYQETDWEEGWEENGEEYDGLGEEADENVEYEDLGLEESEYQEEEYGQEEYREEEFDEEGWEENEEEYDEDLSQLDNGDRSPVFMIIGGVALLAIIIILCVAIWKMSHRKDSSTPLPQQSLEETMGSGENSGTEDSSIADEKEAEENQKSREASESSTPEISSGREEESATGANSGGEVTMTFEEVKETVTAKIKTNLRSEPSTASDDLVAAVLKNGQTAVRTGINKETGWSRLEYNGKTLYAVNQYLTTELTPKNSESAEGESKEAIVDNNSNNTGAVTEYAGGSDAGADGADGADGNIGAEENGAGESNTVSETPPVTNGNTVTTKDGRTVVFTDCDDTVSPKMAVNLRGEPSTSQENASIHARLEYGEKVRRTGISEEAGWSRVEYNGEVLYAVTSYLYIPEE